MKRLFAIMMALAMMLSLGVTAFAEGNGKITITNATADQEYFAYKIFDATIIQEGGVTTGTAYSITTTNPFFEDLFGEEGEAENTYFDYNDKTGAVTLKADFNEEEDKDDLIEYLQGLIEGKTGIEPTTIAIPTVTFDGLDYGYYLITSSLGTAVTINSANPNAEVIDKNQEAGSDFDKWVKNTDETEWGEENTVEIGKTYNYKVEFEGRNYDGESAIEYYKIVDTNDEAVSIDFDTITVMVGNKTLDKDQDWYLTTNGDEFSIMIPWQKGDYTMTEGTPVYGADHEVDFLYPSPVTVVVTYNAALETNALIGPSTDDGENRENTAQLFWNTGSLDPDTVITYTCGLGLLKTDENGDPLAGAKFRLYSDADCSVPVNLIATNVAGKYIVDSAIAREQYAANLEGYLGEGYTNETKDNYVISQETTGKLVILGLDAGTYYLQEVEAPAGYNSLTAPVVLTVDETTATTFEYDETYVVAHKPVQNKKGTVLPSTGGEGTMKMITIGTIIAIGFAVLLITNKKMTIYQD